jgi:multiple antibiotic resistance protein
VSTTLLQFGLLCFVSLFTVTDPVGLLGVYVPMTARLSHADSRRVALRATFTAWIVLMMFALFGRLIFDIFGISVNSLRIVGGVVFFIMGYEMLEARLTRTVADGQSVSEYIEDIAITPLGVPLIAGPAGITTTVVLINQAPGPLEKGIVAAAITLVMAVTFVFLIGARRAMHMLGPSGNKILQRVMGLILMAFAVDFFIAGLRPIVQSFMTTP